jgi:hypothetical protein
MKSKKHFETIDDFITLYFVDGCNVQVFGEVEGVRLLKEKTGKGNLVLLSFRFANLF